MLHFLPKIMIHMSVISVFVTSLLPIFLKEAMNFECGNRTIAHRWLVTGFLPHRPGFKPRVAVQMGYVVDEVAVISKYFSFPLSVIPSCICSSS
jgi:hypothetical protein